MRLLYGQDEAVAAWVAAQIPFVGDRGFGGCKAIGVVSDSGKALCGVVYHDWQPQFGTMAFSIAAPSPRWAHRKMIHALFAYPFEQVGIEKLWTATPSKNDAALRLCTGVGMTTEARLWKHFGDQDAIINRMMKRDYFKRYGVLSGKAQSTNAA